MPFSYFSPNIADTSEEKKLNSIKIHRFYFITFYFRFMLTLVRGTALVSRPENHYRKKNLFMP